MPCEIGSRVRFDYRYRNIRRVGEGTVLDREDDENYGLSYCIQADGHGYFWISADLCTPLDAPPG